jgi:hypothetical protein
MVESRLRLLGRKDCHLCEVAQRDLDILRAHYELLDIDTEPDLLRLYGDAVPVLLDGNRELLRAPMSRSDIERALSGLNAGTRR